jgi:hypothetical protein
MLLQPSYVPFLSQWALFILGIRAFIIHSFLGNRLDQYHSSSRSLDVRTLSITWGLHSDNVGGVSSGCDMQGLLDGGSLHRYREACRSAAHLD